MRVRPIRSGDASRSLEIPRSAGSHLFPASSHHFFQGGGGWWVESLGASREENAAAILRGLFAVYTRADASAGGTGEARRNTYDITTGTWRIKALRCIRYEKGLLADP